MSSALAGPSALAGCEVDPRLAPSARVVHCGAGRRVAELVGLKDAGVGLDDVAATFALEGAVSERDRPLQVDGQRIDGRIIGTSAADHWVIVPAGAAPIACGMATGDDPDDLAWCEAALRTVLADPAALDAPPTMVEAVAGRWEAGAAVVELGSDGGFVAEGLPDWRSDGAASPVKGKGTWRALAGGVVELEFRKIKPRGARKQKDALWLELVPAGDGWRLVDVTDHDRLALTPGG